VERIPPELAFEGARPKEDLGGFTGVFKGLAVFGVEELMVLSRRD
jgi:hypothetical protein